MPAKAALTKPKRVNVAVCQPECPARKCSNKKRNLAVGKAMVVAALAEK